MWEFLLRKEGSKKRAFHHCLVVGLSKSPKPLKKKMNEKQQARANSVRPFCKHVNVRHKMSTRYTLDNYQDLIPSWVGWVIDDDKKLTKRENTKDWDNQDPEMRRESFRASKASFENRYHEGLPKKKERCTSASQPHARC